jgi:hypothetical protein
MPELDIVTTIDQALERYGRRDLISGAEIVDFLLDLRLLALPATPDSPEGIEALEVAPT